MHTQGGRRSARYTKIGTLTLVEQHYKGGVTLTRQPFDPKDVEALVKTW